MGVGEPGYSNGFGRARVFRFQSNVKNGWVQVGQDVLHGKFSASQVGFSIALSANGFRIATSSLAGFTSPYGSGGDSADRLFVHQYNPEIQKWQQVGSGAARPMRQVTPPIYPNPVNPSPAFGSTVALSADGNIVAAGNGVGWAYSSDAVFRVTNGTWIHLREIPKVISLALSSNGNVIAAATSGENPYIIVRAA